MKIFSEHYHMNNFLWLDDDDERVRLPIFGNFAKTAHICIEILKNNEIEYISLDHDLGDVTRVGEGYDVILWIEEALYTNTNGETNYFIPSYYNVHSLNGPASKRMFDALEYLREVYPHIIKAVYRIPYKNGSTYNVLENIYYTNKGIEYEKM